MKYFGLILLLVLSLSLGLFTGCMINEVKNKPNCEKIDNQEDINQSDNNSQSLSTLSVEESVSEGDAGEKKIVYPQYWATGDGTEGNPWGNDCIESAYNNSVDSDTIFLKAGYYNLSTKLIINKKINILGEGRNKTIVKTVNESSILVTCDNCSLQGFTIDGDSQAQVKWNTAISVFNCDYVLLEDIEVKNAGYYGIDIYQVNHSSFKNIYSHDNYREGMHPGSNAAGRNKHNTYQNIYTYNNGFSGFDDRGISEGGNLLEDSYNIYDNIQAWNNGFHGIYIGYQKNIILSNSVARDNGSNGGFPFGIYLDTIEDSNIDNCTTTSNNAKGIGITRSKNIDINDCLSFFNSTEGINLETSKDINLSDVIVKNNGNGIRFENVNNILLSSCQSYDDRNTALQDYGLELNNSDTGISLLNCKLSPNQFGEIYNPSGIAITIITEKEGISSPVIVKE